VESPNGIFKKPRGVEKTAGTELTTVLRGSSMRKTRETKES